MAFGIRTVIAGLRRPEPHSVMAEGGQPEPLPLVDHA
jgi:hypothetical protein